MSSLCLHQPFSYAALSLGLFDQVSLQRSRLIQPVAHFVWLACAIAKGFSLVTTFDRPSLAPFFQKQRQGFVKHSVKSLLCSYLFTDLLLNSQRLAYRFAYLKFESYNCISEPYLMLLCINDNVISIRTAIPQDVPYILELHTAWNKDKLTSLSQGYLSVSYNANLFREMIENNDICVFLSKRGLEGYVLVNTTHESEHVDVVKECYFQLRPDAILKRTAFSYQILIDTPLHGTGFFYRAQELYFTHYKSKYDILISTVSKSNKRSISAHRKAGWSFIDVLKDCYIIEYVI